MQAAVFYDQSTLEGAIVTFMAKLANRTILFACSNTATGRHTFLKLEAFAVAIADYLPERARTQATNQFFIEILARAYERMQKLVWNSAARVDTRRS